MSVENHRIFCTLFDSNYLDKGLALYDSMKRSMKSFKLYIFAFDEKAYEVLCDMSLEGVTVIPLEKIMTDRLWGIKEERTRAEFCWTCTPTVIEYVLTEYQEKVCTYIDADIYFFSDPEIIIQKIRNQGCSVGVTPHRFERTYANIEQIFFNGKYCIQFNTFFHDIDGLKVLNDWKEDCLHWCYSRYEDGKFGDQRYVDTWRMKYDCVYESENPGVGAAPWNLHLYTYEETKAGKIWMSYRKERFPLVFYHFEGMKYLDNGKIYLNLWKCSNLGMRRKVKRIYGEYFHELQSVRTQLKEQYGITFEHMQIESGQFMERGRSLKQFCKGRGLMGGLKEWTGFWINNLADGERRILA